MERNQARKIAINENYAALRTEIKEEQYSNDLRFNHGAETFNAHCQRAQRFPNITHIGLFPQQANDKSQYDADRLKHFHFT